MPSSRRPNPSKPEFDEGTEPQTDGQDPALARREARERRAEEVKRKYDFSVIRTLRQQKSLTIEQFARECGLSYAPISRIETNLIKPNLETLDKIASGLGITTYNLVAMAERRDAQTHQARDFRCGGFAFKMISFEGVEIYSCEARQGAIAKEPDLQSKDLITVTVQRGLLEVKVNEKAWRIGPGQAVSFDCVFPHEYVALEDTSVVIVLHTR